MKTVPSEAERVMVSFSEFGLPEVPLVGRYLYTRAHPPLRQHVHQNAFEACVLQRGTQTYTVGSARLDLFAGDMIITRPGEIHGTDIEPENRGSLYWVQFLRPSRGHSFLGLSAQETRVLFERFLNVRGNLFHHCDLLIPTFERILAPTDESAARLAKASTQNLLLRLILDIIGLTAHTAQHLCSPGVQRALCYLTDNCTAHLSIAALAAVAGMSESYFTVLFKREVGMTPMAYLLRRRVERAKQVLRDSDTPVTSIAFSLGFATSQHFATVFKRLTDHTPRNFRHLCRLQPQTHVQPIAGTGPAFHPVASVTDEKRLLF